MKIQRKKVLLLKSHFKLHDLFPLVTFCFGNISLFSLVFFLSVIFTRFFLSRIIPFCLVFKQFRMEGYARFNSSAKDSASAKGTHRELRNRRNERFQALRNGKSRQRWVNTFNSINLIDNYIVSLYNVTLLSFIHVVNYVSCAGLKGIFC